MIEHIIAKIESIKKIRKGLPALLVCAVVPLLLSASCWSSLDDMYGKIGDDLHQAGEKVTYTAGGVSFKMAFVPGGRTFPTGIDDNGDPGVETTQLVAPTATVPKAFWIAETEVTYELWYAVHMWATTDAGDGRRADGGILYSFVFENLKKPRAGDDGSELALPGPDKDEPVTYLNWRDAMVWTNALTEYYNANNGAAADLDCVYYTDSEYNTPIRSADNAAIVITPGGQDNPFVKSNSRGFRLQGSLEWDMAARYRDGVSWTPGSWASGASADHTDFAATDLVAWFGNSTSAPTGNAVTTHPVKSKKENALGLYDMSGNVWEWCFDWGIEPVAYTKRSARGGSFVYESDRLQVGRVVGQADPEDESNNMGFRFAKTE